MLDLSVGSELAGYRIEGIAARGGMGVVYMATDVALERPVALKLISAELAEDRDFRERFKRESRVAASIRHPNLITIFRAGEEEGRLYIAMEYVEGTDLKALISSRGRLEPPLAAGIVAQVAAALDVAHGQTLVHRDVKPANVLIATEHDSFHAYLTDFGLTKHASSESAMTRTGMVVGTIDYMAPEQIEGAQLDARTDVYSLGCVLYEALTGQVPYPKESNVAKMYAHAREPPPSVVAAASDVAPEFDLIVARAMAKDRAERYLSAGDLGRAALAAAEGRRVAPTERSVASGEAAPRDSGAPATALSPGPKQGPPSEPATAPPATVTSGVPERRRSRRLALGVAALLAAVAAAAVLFAGGGGEKKTPPLSKDQYQDRVLDVARPFSAQAASLEASLPAHVSRPQSAIRAASGLAGLRKTADRLVAGLHGMVPPADVRDLHGRLVQLVKRLRSHVADAGAAADSSNDRVYRAVQANLGRDVREIDALGPEFDSRGYKRLGF